MNALFGRSSTMVGQLCLAAVLGVIALCGVGIAGMHVAAEQTEIVTSDEIADTAINARFAHAVDRAYSTGLALALGSPEPGLATSLYDEQMPLVEARLSELQQIHADEKARELDDVQRLTEQWVALRSALNDLRAASSGEARLDARLRSLYVPLTETLEEMLHGETTDAGARSAASSSEVDEMTTTLVVSTLVAIALFIGLAVLTNRRVRRELEPAQDQVEFADTLQLAQSEDEAHQLLQRRLVRIVPDSFVTILNRNNSADRLEAKTDVPQDSGLAARLDQAVPRSCLAIRSARAHEEDPDRPALLGCEVCQPCGGFSTCAPLTVGGEVIGSVLMNRPGRYQASERRQTHEAVSQAAPVLANLRNLSIAQLRAATDALTGLPNKRAVADSLKRMFAQSSRTLSPLSLILLDLDHFKALNDRFGHPVGDQVLASVGAVMRSTLRDSDFAGRNGGEEFAVILPDTDSAGARDSAEKLRLAISAITIPGLDLELTASLGVAAYPEHAVGPERLERLADASLYVAKRSGRNRVEVATATPDGPEEGDALVRDPAVPAGASRNGAGTPF
jgi:diguanylate cyclase (GGDEF)-like protein